MIKVNKNHVEVEGYISQVLVELSILITSLKDNKDVPTDILLLAITDGLEDKHRVQSDD